jgi:hypothetical protein
VNLLARELNRGNKEVEKAQGNLVFLWAGNNYPCVADRTTAEQLLTLGGEQMHSDLALHVRASLLPNPGPREKQVIAFDGRSYRIDKVAKIHGGGIVTLICQDKAQGA